MVCSFSLFPTIPMIRHQLLLLTLALLLPTLRGEERPNFVFIISDDIGFDDLGCYGSIDSRTPHLDALAEEGLLFTNAYLTASSCSPSRSSIITGRYPHNNGDAAELHRAISWHIPSFPGVLREAGYHTALAGKDHMMWHPAPESEQAPAEPFEVKYPSKVKGNSGGHGNWIKALEERPADQPFFLWLAALDAHRGWDGDREWDERRYGPMHDPAHVVLPPAFVDTPDTRQDFASYLNEVTRFDYFVGRVVDYLKAENLFGNTYVFAVTDNGRPFPRAKTRLIDDGMKTFFIATGPAIQRPGTITDSLVSVIDIAPTIAELAGLPSSETFQGRSLTPIFADATASVRPYAFSEHNWHDYEAHGRSVRDGRWLYLENNRPGLALQGPADSVKSPTFQDLLAAAASSEPLPPIQADVLLAPRPEVELYDMDADPRQIANLAGDPDFASVEKRLADALAKWSEETADSVPDEVSLDGFDRRTGSKIFEDRDEYQRPPPGADKNADRVNAEGL